MALIAQLTDPYLRDDGADPFHDPVAAMRRAFAQIRPVILFKLTNVADRRPGKGIDVLIVIPDNK